MKNEILPSTELLTCNEVEIHYKRPVFSSMKKITSSKDAIALMRKFHQTSFDVKEHFWLICLSSANHALNISTIGVGCTQSSPVDIKAILQTALLSHATAIIAVHNHPSGNLIFSHSDIQVTNKIIKACELFSLVLLDHIIITSESYCSMADSRISPFT
mgnify:CR=1 FL=1